MPKITISYRRDDTGAITGRIFDRLEARYGREAIFRDIDDIPLGSDYRQRINDVIERTDILLVVMGSKWLGPRRNRKLRINDDADPVRVEIEIALSRSVPLIPVLIDNAKMPQTTDLPPSLCELAFRNAAKVDSMYDFDHNVDRLIRQIDNILSERKIDPAEISDSLGNSHARTDVIPVSPSAHRDADSNSPIAIDAKQPPELKSESVVSGSMPSPSEIRIGPFLRMPGSLEIKFRRRYNEENSSVARLALLTAALIYLAFYFFDRLIDDAHSTQTLAVRVIVSAVLISFLALPKMVFSRFLSPLMLSAIMVSGLGLLAIVYIAPAVLPVGGLSAVVLILMFSFGPSRMLFVPSMVCGIVFCVGYNLSAIEVGLTWRLIVANNFFLVSVLCCGGAVTYLTERLARVQFLTDRELQLERARVNAPIENLLPARIVERLKTGEPRIAESHSEATVLVCDLVGFTSLMKRLSASHVVELLNDIFSLFDEATGKHDVEKIKTIGDAYIVAAGVGTTRGNGVEAVADFVLEIESKVAEYAKARGFPIALRAGIATGQVISGVIGLKKQSFDIWGETVDQARRLNALSDQGLTQVNEAAYWRLRDKYDFKPGGKIEMDNLGKVQTYFLMHRKVLAPIGLRSDGKIDPGSSSDLAGRGPD
jgi:adenylate cyclase